MGTSNSSNAIIDAPSDALCSTSVKRATWGIFNIAYEPPSWRAKVANFSFTEPLIAAFHCAPFISRFLSELCFIAPKYFVSYILAFLWISVAPALSLYLSYLIIDTVRVSRLRVRVKSADHI
jgi:hypothetical protein